MAPLVNGAMTCKCLPQPIVKRRKASTSPPFPRLRRISREIREIRPIKTTKVKEKAKPKAKATTKRGKAKEPDPKVP